MWSRFAHAIITVCYYVWQTENNTLTLIYKGQKKTYVSHQLCRRNSSSWPLVCDTQSNWYLQFEVIYVFCDHKDAYRYHVKSIKWSGVCLFNKINTYIFFRYNYIVFNGIYYIKISQYQYFNLNLNYLSLLSGKILHWDWLALTLKY